MDAEFALCKRVVKRFGKLRLRLTLALLRLICPSRLRIGLLRRAARIRPAAVLNRKFRFQFRRALCIGCGFAFRFCFRLRSLGERLLFLLRQMPVLDAVDVLHQQRRILARIRQGGLVARADGLVKRIPIQPRLRVVDLVVLHKRGKAHRSALQLARVLLDYGVERIYHLFVFTLDDLRVAQHPLAVRAHARRDLERVALRLGLERVRGLDRLGQKGFRLASGALARLLCLRAHFVRLRLGLLEQLCRVLLGGLLRVEYRLLARAVSFHQLIERVDARFQQRDALKTLFQEELHLSAFHSSTSSFSCCASL